MSGLALFLWQMATPTTECSRSLIEQAHLVSLQEVQQRATKILEERRLLMARRSEFAKRAVELAEMSPMKRELRETFGKNNSQEDLERLDRAYTARINTIADESQLIKADSAAATLKYRSELNWCGCEDQVSAPSR